MQLARKSKKRINARGMAGLRTAQADTPKSKTINLSPELHRRLRTEAFHRGETMMDLLERAFDHLLTTEKDGCGPVPTPAQEYLDFVENAPEELVRVVNDLLHFWRSSTLGAEKSSVIEMK